MRKLIAGTVLAVAALFGAGAAGYAPHGSSGPICPTEDSCTAGYSGGSWHITPVVP
jgi:hypothetical protein